jgi:hypothetical protein
MVKNRSENVIMMWFKWHFIEVPSFLFSVWKNYLAFGSDFFSIPLLLSTLFSPWRRYLWNFPRGFNILEYLNTIVSNFFSRIIGALCRLMLIALGIIFLALIALVGALGMVVWIFLPLLWIPLLLMLWYGRSLYGI